MAAATKNFQSAISGAKIARNNAEVVAQSDVVFLAVKPQHMTDVMSEVKPAVSPDKLLVSIAAGVTLARLCAGLGTNRVVRRWHPRGNPLL